MAGQPIVRLPPFALGLLTRRGNGIYILHVEYDKDKVDDLVLALLQLTSFRHHRFVRAWKSRDWDALDRLCDKGFISDPKQLRLSMKLRCQQLPFN